MKEYCNYCGKELKNVIYTPNGERFVVFYDNVDLHLAVKATMFTRTKSIPVVPCGECIIESISGERLKK